MEAHTIRIAGRRKINKHPSLKEIDDFLKLGMALRKIPSIVPRGVFRFKTFEEAQEWMHMEMIKTLKKNSQDRHQ